MSNDKSIYEIFRSCRLCGAGGGYKMPIIPSVVGFDCTDIELRQKIRECVQIEVSQDDKMPPLICELCVDKVNDFYEFLNMCRQTNVRTRDRLGLPPPSLNQSDAGDCILGVTEQILSHNDDDQPTVQAGKTVNKHKKKDHHKFRSLRKGFENLIIKQEPESSGRESRSSRSSRDSRAERDRADESQPSRTRQRGDMTLSQYKENHQKSILKKDSSKAHQVINLDDDDDDSLVVHRSKRSHEKTDRESKETQDNKKIKLTIKLNPEPKVRPGPKSSKRYVSPPPSPKSKRSTSPLNIKSKRSNSPTPKKRLASPPPPKKRLASPPPKKRLASPPPKKRLASPPPKKRLASPPKKRLASPSSKSLRSTSPVGSKKRSLSPGPNSKPPKKRAATPPPQFPCDICGLIFRAVQGRTSHMRSAHTVGFTSPDLSCNACGVWFPDTQEAATHHQRHSASKPYRCRGCRSTFKLYQAYTQHVANDACVPWTEVPDVKCKECWKEFPTRGLLDAHRCSGTDSRPGGKCRKCNKNYQTLKNLKKHESMCSSKKKAGGQSEIKISAGVRSKLKPVYIRTARCDSLLRRNRRRCDVSDVPDGFDLDHRCVYPYRSVIRVKKEHLTFDGMVIINQDIRASLYKEEDYVHWDSDCSDSDEEYSLVNPTERIKKVPSLTALSLKTLYSNQCLGKVPKRLRKVKNEKFDSFFNTDFDMQNDINNIIDNLSDDNDEVTSESKVKSNVSDVKNSDNDDSNKETVKSSDSVVNIDINDVNDADYDSDSLLDKSCKVNQELNFDSLINDDNKHDFNVTKDKKVDDGSLTDASLDEVENSNCNDTKTINDFDDKETCSGNSQDDVLSRKSDANFENVNGNSNSQLTNQSNELMKELNDLNCSDLDDKKLLDALDEQINEKNVEAKENDTDKIVLSDLVPGKERLNLEGTEDQKFNFNAEIKGKNSVEVKDDTEKILLSDLVPSRDNLDLEGISDTEFDFNA